MTYVSRHRMPIVCQKEKQIECQNAQEKKKHGKSKRNINNTENISLE